MMALQWCWAIIWFVVLILLAWPIGFIAATFYVILSPFTVCCICMKVITDFLMKGVNLPMTVASYLVTGKSCGAI